MEKTFPRNTEEIMMEVRVRSGRRPQGWHGRGRVKFRTVREQTVVEHERQILKQTAEGVKVMPQEHTGAVRGTMRFLVWLRERRGGAEHIVAVPVAQILKETDQIDMFGPTQTSATAGCGCANAANYGRNRRVGFGPKRTRATTD